MFSCGRRPAPGLFGRTAYGLLVVLSTQDFRAPLAHGCGALFFICVILGAARFLARRARSAGLLLRVLGDNLVRTNVCTTAKNQVAFLI